MSPIEEKVIPTAEKLREFLAIAFNNYTSSQLEEAEKLYTEAKNYAEEIHDADSLYKAHLGLAKISMQRGHFDVVVENITDALQITSALEIKREEASCLNILGIALSNLGDFSSALTNYFSGLKISRELNNKKLESQFLNNISNCYSWMEDFNNSLEYAETAMALANEVGNPSDICSMKSNLGFLYSNLNRLDDALKLMNESLEMNINLVKNNDALAKTYNNIASVYLKQKDYHKALDYYSKCMEIVTENKDESTMAHTELLIGNAYFHLNEFEAALIHQETALDIALRINSKKLQNKIYYHLSYTYESLEEYEKAYEVFENYYKLETQATKDFSDLKVKYLNVAHKVDVAKKEAEILHEKNEELDALNNALRALHEEKNEFLGIAVHDLKNPLNGISLAASALIKNINKVTPEKFESVIQRIESVTDRMKMILSNLLDVNAIESGEYKLNLKFVNISSLVLEIVSHFKHIAEEKNIILEYENKTGEMFFLTDETALTEILENLISNAIKYSDKNKNVWIILSDAVNNFKVQIIDTGLGIKEEEQEKVFKKFAKISNKPTAGENSTGLGLSIVKKLTEMLGGNISFKSVYGSGTTFTLEF
ncbi:MAG: tetratricopeptide repeat-containing sensor histidine kinase [Bacteroidetes bacterium]|nr:tetratricopeptide repeat-containing sensor histidine kinase [Bacteroidota bacterium]